MKANKIVVSAVSGAEQRRRIDQAIARRAYEIFASLRCAPGHELEDWRQAESEVRSNFCFGLTTSIDSVLFECDAASFEPGSLQVWVAPRQVTLSGKPLRPKQLTSGGIASVYSGTVFRVITLPVVIDPSRVYAHWKSNFLEIRLSIVGAPSEVHARAV